VKAATTLPRLLRRNAAGLGNRPALREKRGGIWQVLTWSDYAALVMRFAGALAAQGFARGDRLAVIGDNRLRLYAAMLAAQSLGGVAVPLPPDAEADWIAQVLSHAGVSIVVAEDAEQVEKIVAARERAPGLRLVVQTTTHGMRQVQHDWLTSFEAFADCDAGAAEQSEPGDAALLLYDNDPGNGLRAATLSHDELLQAAEALIAAEQIRQSDETVAWLPMAWLADTMSSLALSMAVGFTCNCPEHPETARRDLREIGPTILIAPQRVWEGMLADIETRSAQATGMKRLLIRYCRSITERAQRHRAAGEAISPLLRLRIALADVLVFAPMRDQIGLRRLRWASTGGEPLAPRIVDAFSAFGINLKQSHAMAEPAGAALEPAHA
jgi:long-chain acyl-CoA synthetase